MVVKYIKVTFVTIFSLVVGLISTVNIKGAETSGNGITDLGLIWYTHTHPSYGVSQYTQISTNGDGWYQGYVGEVTNYDDPMIITVMDYQGDVISEMILEPNRYIIVTENYNENNKTLKIFIGDTSVENQVYYNMYSNNINLYYTIELRYYTSGILKDYYDLGLDVGYDIGNQQVHNVGVELPNGVSDTIEFRNGEAYYVQRVKKYTLMSDDIVSYSQGFTNVDVYLINKNIDSSGYNNTIQNWYLMFPYINTDYAIDDLDFINKISATYNLNYLALGVSKGSYADLAEAKADLVGTEIYYQLAEPIETIMGVSVEYQDGFYDAVDYIYGDGFGGIYNPYVNEYYTNESSYPYTFGFDDAVNYVYVNGFGGIYNPYVYEYYTNERSYPFYKGIQSANDYSFTGLLFQVFNGMGSILTIELLPNVTLGAIVAVPLVFGIIYFILGKRKGD